MKRNILEKVAGSALKCKACRSGILYTKEMVLNHIRSERHYLKVNSAYADLTPEQKQKLDPIIE